MTAECARLVHADVSWIGDEKNGRLNDKSKLILDLGRLVKVNHGSMEGTIAVMMR
jgi:hypothetical protein